MRTLVFAAFFFFVAGCLFAQKPLPSPVAAGPGGGGSGSITGGTCTNQLVSALSTGGVPTCSSVSNAMVSSGLDAVKIGSGAVSNTEFGYLDGVTSGIQGQIDGKQATLSAASTIVNLFSGCSGTQYLGADGACHAASGASPGGSPNQIQIQDPSDPTKLSGASDITVDPVSYELLITPPAGPTVPPTVGLALAGQGAGNLSNDLHAYSYTFRTAQGEGVGSSGDDIIVIDNSTDGKVAVSWTPLSDPRITGVCIYRKLSGFSSSGSRPYYRVACTSAPPPYIDNISDDDLGPIAGAGIDAFDMRSGKVGAFRGSSVWQFMDSGVRLPPGSRFLMDAFPSGGVLYVQDFAGGYNQGNQVDVSTGTKGNCARWGTGSSYTAVVGTAMEDAGGPCALIGTSSTNKAICWKTSTTLGYCSDAPDGGGNCTCN